jgi:hypothetical protein
MTEYQQSIENSFKILTGQATIETICIALTLYFQGEDVPDVFPIFFIEPDAIPEPDQIDSMIDHFEFYEEYEKCTWLLDYKKKL